jgi:hypothetical protein
MGAVSTGVDPTHQPPLLLLLAANARREWLTLAYWRGGRASTGSQAAAAAAAAAGEPQAAGVGDGSRARYVCEGVSLPSTRRPVVGWPGLHAPSHTHAAAAKLADTRTAAGCHSPFAHTPQDVCRMVPGDEAAADVPAGGAGQQVSSSKRAAAAAAGASTSVRQRPSASLVGVRAVDL